MSIGVTALGPRKKIIHALSQFREEGTNTTETHTDAPKAIVEETDKQVANKLITDYFPGHVADRPKVCVTSRGKNKVEKSNSDSGCKSVVVKNHVKNRKLREIPLWCSIPGTPFRVVSALSPVLNSATSFLILLLVLVIFGLFDFASCS